MKLLRHVRVDEAEIEGFFDEDGKIVGAWALNDAHWRGEYMNPFLKKLGFKVLSGNATETERKAILEVFGLTEEDLL